MHDTNDERRDELPDHEFRDIEQAGDVGAGVMSTGGTATDRGTGTLDGVAQGGDQGDLDEDDDALVGDVAEGEVPHLGTPPVPAHPEIDSTHLRR